MSKPYYYLDGSNATSVTIVAEHNYDPNNHGGGEILSISMSAEKAYLALLMHDMLVEAVIGMSGFVETLGHLHNIPDAIALGQTGRGLAERLGHQEDATC